MAAVVDFNMVLEWVGIATAAQRTNVCQNIGSVEYLSSLTAKDISDLVDNLRRCTYVALGKYNMPLVVQKRLKNAQCPDHRWFGSKSLPRAIIDCRIKGGYSRNRRNRLILSAAKLLQVH